MRSKNSYRPQNQHPDRLVQSRKQVAEQHYQQVRVVVQAMLRRGMEPSKITAAAVAKEAKVSVAIIYRRADLFTLVQRANPSIQRRRTEQVYRRTVQRLQTELEKARADTEYYQKEAQLAKLAERRPGQEVMQLKKTILALQRQVADLERQLAHCTVALRPLAEALSSMVQSQGKEYVLPVHEMKDHCHELFFHADSASPSHLCPLEQDGSFLAHRHPHNGSG